MYLTKKMLGARITRFRKMKGLSQEELAQNIAMSRSALAKIETGHRTVSALELNAISHALGFSLDEFLSDDFVKVFTTECAGTLLSDTTASPYPEKLRTVLLYILEQCAGKPNVGETVLYKILYFSDFNYYELYQEYLTGMKYRKLPYGPVPFRIEQFISDMIQTGDLQRIKCRYQSYWQIRYVPLRQPNLALLTEREIDVIGKVVDQLSDMSATAISAWSHNDKPWVVSQSGQEIDYALVRLREPPYSVSG